MENQTLQPSLADQSPVKPKFAEWIDVAPVKIPLRMRWRLHLRSYLFWVEAVAILGLAMQLVSGLMSSNSAWFVPAFLLAGLAQVAGILKRAKGVGNEAPWPVARLLDIPTPANQFPVDTSFQTEGITYGEVQGVLTFAEGWMSFSSPSISWSVRASDFVSIKRDKPGTGLCLEMEHSGRRFVTTIEPYSSALIDRDRFHFTRESFGAQVTEWMAGVPQGISILPPIFPKPSVLRPGHTLKVAASIFLSSISVSGLAFICLGPVGLLAGVFLAVASVVIAVRMGVSRRQDEWMRAGLSPRLVKHWTELDLKDLFVKRNG